jgi:hypothetical protein
MSKAAAAACRFGDAWISDSKHQAAHMSKAAAAA